MKQVLVIDDDPQFRAYVVALLRRRGYHVEEAENGAKALALLRTLQVDVIITDIVMPDMEGLETIRMLQAAGSSAKIVAVSGGGESGRGDYLRFAERLGASATLRKPFSPPEMLETIARLVA